MRVFIGSSREQRRLVEWLTDFMRSEYRGILEPVPWTVPWAGGRYTLENLLGLVDETDAAILFWTADDKTWYRDAEHQEPRDNLVFEAGLFIATHGRERTQLMVPSYDPGDFRSKIRVPTDVAGLTYNLYSWNDGSPEVTGLPNKARVVCDTLRALRPRPRVPQSLRSLAGHDKVEEIRTFVGEWQTIHSEGITRLAARDEARVIDVLAAYRIGEIRRVLDRFRQRPEAQLRACFGNMWDDELLRAYQRKYYDRNDDYIRNALKESIEFLIGPCEVQVIVGASGQQEIKVTSLSNSPQARYEIRLTSQRITYGYYRVDGCAFLVPLDMKRDQNPAPLAWVVAQDTAPRTFEHYLQEYERLFAEALRVFP